MTAPGSAGMTWRAPRRGSAAFWGSRSFFLGLLVLFPGRGDASGPRGKGGGHAALRGCRVSRVSPGEWGLWAAHPPFGSKAPMGMCPPSHPLSPHLPNPPSGLVPPDPIPALLGLGWQGAAL